MHMLLSAAAHFNMPGATGAHSLRFGGASAIWAAFQNSAQLQRFGRWTSDIYHEYSYGRAGANSPIGFRPRAVSAPNGTLVEKVLTGGLPTLHLPRPEALSRGPAPLGKGGA